MKLFATVGLDRGERSEIDPFSLGKTLLRVIFARSMRDLDAGLLLIRTRTHQKLQQRTRFAQRTLAECTHFFFLRKARQNSEQFVKLLQDFGTKLVSSRRRWPAFVGSERTIDSIGAAIRFA